MACTSRMPKLIITEQVFKNPFDGNNIPSETLQIFGLGRKLLYYEVAGLKMVPSSTVSVPNTRGPCL